METETREHGFTLVEMMAAMAVTGLLAVAALGTIVAVDRGQRQLQKEHDSSAASKSIEDLMLRDMVQAERFRSVTGGFELDSHAAMDGADCHRVHVPCTVAFVVRPVSGQLWLLRNQRGSDGSTVMELVAPGIKSVAFEGSQPEAAWKAMPDSVTVTMQWDSGEVHVFRCRIR